ncbi:hypothetical protein ACFSCX_07915 [Bacillus salitolerans]|uniref:Uncharacterized protein n=1 Tax=Bacillus salitolerans TaxID=1437434 RepID=A0ABW4LMW5_9BACI
MERFSMLWAACILAGYALLKVPLPVFLEPFSPFVHLVGALTILLFSSVIIFAGIKALFSSR